jgi:PAS domain S-box-containing protein
MSLPTLRVLLVEDDPDDHLLTRKLVEAVPDERVELAWEPTFDGALEALARDEYDVLLVDYRLDGRTGLELIQEARRRHCTTPVVVLTGVGDRALDQEAMRTGASDYLVKGQLDPRLLGRTLRRAAERHAAGQAAARLAAVVEQSSDAICALAPDGTVVSWNPAAARTYGYTADEMVGEPVFRLAAPEHAAGLRGLLDTVLRGERVEAVDTEQLRRDGGRISVSLSLAPVLDAAGRVRYASLIARDVTERKRLEEEFRQAQKLEVVGRLAGGVAHDFNNLLTAIRGTAELLLADMGEGHPMRADLQVITQASERAASLTRQLLAFSKQQAAQPRVVDLNGVVAGADRILRRLVGAGVELVTVLSPETGSVRVDPVQVEQVLTNLALNARDAMPGGGRLLVQTREVAVPAGGSPLWPGVPAGPHAMLAVSDNGTGMDDATRSRIFEPFFTTKPPGKGTGLGLATVYGIVQQSGGHVLVHTGEGEGTTFQIFFPRASEEVAGPPAAAPEPASAPAPTATVLLVDDEAPVRTLVRRVLAREGYTVLEAPNGEEGLRLWREHAEVSLVVTDMVMPLMGGREMVRRMHEAKPGLPVVFMSGYSQEAHPSREAVRAPVELIPKPFDVRDLVRAVRLVLAESSPDGRG